MENIEATAVQSPKSQLVEGIGIDTTDDQISEDNLSPRELIARKHAKEQRGFDHIRKEDPEKEEPDKEPTTKESDEQDPNVAPKQEKVDTDYIDVKINGVTRKVEKSKVEAAGGLRAYQKEVSASEKLQKVAEERALLDKRARELDQREAEQKAREEAQKRAMQPSTPDAAVSGPPQGDQLQAELAEKAKAYRQAMYSDDEAAADKALADVILAAQRSSATPKELSDQIGELAANRAIEKVNALEYEKRHKSALVKFDVEYSDIAEDPKLRDMADRETDIILRERPEWAEDPERIIDEAARRTREYIDNLRGIRDEEESQDPMKAKIEEKRALTPPKSGNGKPALDSGPKVQTRSDYISELRKKRGLE